MSKIKITTLEKITRIEQNKIRGVPKYNEVICHSMRKSNVVNQHSSLDNTNTSGMQHKYAMKAERTNNGDGCYCIQFSSSLHVTRLTCLHDVSTSPNHLVPTFLQHQHLNQSDDDLIDPNQLWSEHQKKKLGSSHSSMKVEEPVQAHFYSDIKLR